MQPVGVGSNSAPDAPNATCTAATAVSGVTPETATMLNGSSQGSDAAQTEHSQPLDATEPRANDSDVARGVAETGTSADEGRRGGLAGAIEQADERQGGDARPSQEVLAAPDDTLTQPSESHCELGSGNQNNC
ncbi:uncharacterized protein B0H18DRAFT_1007426 [Fomitopsis serialis]|uniref:uncharacterized protein n=1 Tax=Fomitopsis serialis TaxID=139415 RepID=UPI002007DE79|nr:uncharacterized protein B0H18DRAFT_1007426 [Neoantrodia serialis]KAH9926006.1 hypothetical protein B0H18DRAFT_1007426 [Neoantrodia serialis]